MSLVHRIKELADYKNVTFAEIERNIEISNGQIRRWDKTSPKTETIQKIADYFNVSIDYLVGRTDYPAICTGGENNTPLRLAAHIDEDGITEDDMEEIINYIAYIKSKHAK